MNPRANPLHPRTNPTTPVSYTHLDVYKRQVYGSNETCVWGSHNFKEWLVYWRTWRMITSIEKTGPQTKGTTSGMNITVQLISMDHTITVSYTHLDVYKRQQ